MTLWPSVSSDEALARHVRSVAAAEMDRLENPKAGQTVSADLEEIQHRVRTGLPLEPIPGAWAW